jgi:MOSC domain-containing protein YiiM
MLEAMSQPTIVSVQVGMPRELQEEKRAYMTAIFKSPPPGPVWVGASNVEGDAQADLKHHGGPDRAVLSYSVDHYPVWRDEQPQFDFPNGCFGENLSVVGLDETNVCIGDVYEVGETVLEVTYPRVPCYKLNGRSGIPALLTRVIATGRIGWFHRVLQEGRVAAGQALTLRNRPHPEWTIARAYDVFKALSGPGPAPLDEARELAVLPALAETWRTALPILIERASARAAK